MSAPTFALTFLEPGWLALLLGVLALAAAYLVLQVRRRHYAVRFPNLDLLSSVAPRRPGWRRHLAGPVREVQVGMEAATVMLGIDVSRSMEATDVAPSRMASARDAASGFVEELPDGFDIGLVVFDGSARVLSTPTQDHDAILDAIAGIETGHATAAGEGLHAALEAIEVAQEGDTAAEGDAPSASVVLLSDGATTVGMPVADAAEEAVEMGVPVSTITFGTADGELEVDGETVQVPPDTASMAELAETTGGQTFAAASGDELRAVYEDIQARVGYDTEEQEVSRVFMAAGLVVVLLAAGAAMVWTGRFL